MIEGRQSHVSAGQRSRHGQSEDGGGGVGQKLQADIVGRVGRHDPGADYIEHLYERCPQALPYLGLLPGWRSLVAPDYSDVWDDPTLLNI